MMVSRIARRGTAMTCIAAAKGLNQTSQAALKRQAEARPQATTQKKRK